MFKDKPIIGLALWEKEIEKLLVEIGNAICDNDKDNKDYSGEVEEALGQHQIGNVTEVNDLRAELLEDKYLQDEEVKKRKHQEAISLDVTQFIDKELEGFNNWNLNGLMYINMYMTKAFGQWLIIIIKLYFGYGNFIY